MPESISLNAPSNDVVNDNIKGSKDNPYSIGESISINNIYFDDESFDMNITFDSYSPSSNLLSVTAEVTRYSGSGSVYPFEFSSGVFVQYVDSKYSILGPAYETTDKSDLDILSSNNLGLYSGGNGNTYLFSYNEAEWAASAEYAVIVVYDDDTQGETDYWVKLN